MPPSTWPSAPVGFRTRPKSCPADTFSTRTTPVSRSTRTWAPWAKNAGAAKVGNETRPTQPTASPRRQDGRRGGDASPVMSSPVVLGLLGKGRDRDRAAGGVLRPDRPVRELQVGRVGLERLGGHPQEALADVAGGPHDRPADVERRLAAELPQSKAPASVSW